LWDWKRWYLMPGPNINYNTISIIYGCMHVISVLVSYYYVICNTEESKTLYKNTGTHNMNYNNIIPLYPKENIINCS
jgi:hypothetical protein